MRLIKMMFLFGSLLSLLFFTGCWDLVEITHRSRINAISLEKSNDQSDKPKVIMSASLDVPGSSMPPYSGTDQQFAKINYLLAGTGYGILDAWKSLQMVTSRQIFFGQLRAIILSERFAQDNLRGMVNFFSRLPQLPNEVNLLFTHEDPARLLDQKLKSNMLPGNYISDFLNIPSKETTANPMELWQVMTALADGTADPYMPVIQLAQGQYKIAGLALFSTYKYVGELSEEETQTLSLLRNLLAGYLTVPISPGAFISFAGVQSKTKIKPRVDPTGDLRFDIICNVSGALRETIPDTFELKPKMQQEFQRYTQIYITQNLTRLMAKLQRLNSDPIGFGRKVRAEIPDYWEKNDWHKVYPYVKIKVRVKFSNRNTGVLR